MDAEDRQKEEAAAKRAAKRERLSKQKAEALSAQEDKAAAEAAAAGQAADEAAEADEVSLCACAAAGARLDESTSFYNIPALSGSLAMMRACEKLGAVCALSHLDAVS